MSTSRTTLSKLKAQADSIAKSLKAIERGETIVTDPGGKLRESLKRGVVNLAVAMDYKVITVEMAWSEIKKHSEASLSAYFLKYMQGQRTQ